MRYINLFICLLIASQTAAAAPISVGFGPGIRKNVRTFKEMRQENVVTQNFDYSCGPASMATLLSYYFGDTVTENEIIAFLLRNTDLAKVKRRLGFSLLDLKNFARYKGYEVTGYRMDLDFLVELKEPVLVPVRIKDYAHFVVFRGKRGDRVFLADPALGNVTMRAERFLGIWQGGVGLLVSKSDKKNTNPPLELTDQEKAVFADPAMVRKVFGVNSLGQVYGMGEF